MDVAAGVTVSVSFTITYKTKTKTTHFILFKNYPIHILYIHFSTNNDRAPFVRGTALKTPIKYDDTNKKWYARAWQGRAELGRGGGCSPITNNSQISPQ